MKNVTSTSLKPASQPLPEVDGSPLWQSIRAVLQPIAYLEQLRDRYGDIFRMRASAFPQAVVLSDPEAIEAVFTADPNQFNTAIGNQLLQPLLGERSLVLLDGAAHRNRRKLMMPPFHGQQIQAYDQAMREIVQQVINQWMPDRPFSMYSAMQEISSRIVLRVVFGLEEGERYERLRQLLIEILDRFNSPWRSLPLFLPQLRQDWGAWSPWGRFVRIKQTIRELLSAEIRERRLQPGQKDVLSLLLLARDEAGEAMTEAELEDQLITLLFAGHETTSASLAWAFYWIYSLPEVQKKVLAELADLDIEADSREIAKLPYLHALCSETLRIYPVLIFAFGRLTKIPFQVLNYEIPPGLVLEPCIYLLHHRPDLYPEPKQFRPERFLERQFSPYEYIPFGGGNRRCLGYAFAQFEMKLVLAKILRQVNLELIQKSLARPIRRGFTLVPSGGVRMVAVSKMLA